MKESGEMYLETVLKLQTHTPEVHSIDVARELGFSKPSVSRAVSLLKEEGYLAVTEQGHLELTETGRMIATKIYERHSLLTRVLVLLGVDEKTAADDACKIEHDISDLSFEAIKRYVTEKFG